MREGSIAVGLADPDWRAFIERLEAAEVEFACGRPDDFKALWSHAADVTLSGELGGKVERGWESVAARLDWASANYADATRGRQELGGAVGADFAYLVQTETIEYRIPGRDERRRDVLRVTMVFRREADAGWRIVHRHADSQTSVQPQP